MTTLPKVPHQPTSSPCRRVNCGSCLLYTSHFLIVHVDETVVHPVAGKLTAIGALALGNLGFVVGEDQILTAAVQVDGLAQMCIRDRR